MRAIWKRLLPAGLAALLLLSACGTKQPPADSSETGSETGTGTETGSAGEADFPLVRDGKAIPVVYAEAALASDAGRLAEAIGERAGLENGKAEDRSSGVTDPNRAEILIGRVDCAESTQAYAELADYSECRVRIIGNKLVIASLEAASVTQAVTKLRLMISRMEDTSRLALEQTFSQSYYSGSTKALAKLPIAEGQTLTFIEETQSSLQVLFSNPGSEAFEAYCEKLAASGYTLRSEEEQEENRHKTYTNGRCAVLVSLFPGINRLCLFVDPYKKEGQLPAAEASYTPLYDTTLLTQLGLYSNDPDVVDALSEAAGKQLTNDSGGMGYVIRLRDGRFLLIDGGYGVKDNETTLKNGVYMESEEYRNDPEKQGFEDADRIYNVMKSQTAEGEEPVIAAWIFTHADVDHVGAFVKFAEKYGKNGKSGKDIRIGQLIYNFPAQGVLSNAGDVRTSVEQAINQYYAGTPVVTAHAGQVYHIANLTIRMLVNLELLEPNLPNGLKFNDTSLVFQIETEDGTRLMILGDCYPNEAGLLDKLYTSETLRSNIVQVSHHGIEGVGHGDGVYEAIGATAALWPAGTWKYNYPCTMVNWSTDPDACRTWDERDAKHNKWIMDNIGEDKIYLAGGENTTFELRDHGLTPTP